MTDSVSGERAVVIQDWLTGQVLGLGQVAADAAPGLGVLSLRWRGDVPREVRGRLEPLPDGGLLLRLDSAGLAVGGEQAQPGSFMDELEATLLARQRSTADKSYTKSLLEKGAGKIGEKLREEADELARALAGETDERVVSEAADVVYHLMVGLRLRERAWREVLAVLESRTGRSGLEEKASRRH